MSSSAIKTYQPAEERLNIASHAVGLVLSVAATVMLLLKAIDHGGALEIVGAIAFGAGLVALFGASTAYHAARDSVRRQRLRVLDHAAIFLLIAGTYTPFCLVTLDGPLGWTILTASWAMAVVGITLKLFFTGRFRLVSTAMYVFMGWIIVFALKPLIANLPAAGLAWTVAGGLAYTLGAVLYSIGRIPFNHAIFHVLVLVGAACHFVAVYCYVL